MNKEGRSGVSVTLSEQMNKAVRDLGAAKGMNNKTLFEFAMDDYLSNGEERLVLYGCVRAKRGKQFKWGAVLDKPVFDRMQSLCASQRMRKTDLSRSLLVRYLNKHKDQMQLDLPVTAQASRPAQVLVRDEPIVTYAKIASKDGEYYASCPHCHRALPRFAK